MDRKRELKEEENDEYEENSEVPAKKARETVFENMEIPESCVGIVIGRGGCEVRSICQQSRCRVQVAKEPSTNGRRTVTIEGMPEEIDIAKRLINTVVNIGTIPVPIITPISPLMTQIPLMPSERITTQIMIPAAKVGLIIGKGGETMKKLRATTSCFLQLIQDFNQNTSEPKPLRITGFPAAVERAQQLVFAMLESGDLLNMAANGRQNSQTITVKVPRAAVGAIMGVGGQTIREISVKMGCKIQFLQNDDAMLPERTLAIVGHPNCVSLAVQAIREIVDGKEQGGAINQSGELVIFCMTIPASKTGHVIGRGGETIRHINAESGAHCELSRDPDLNPLEKMFVIRGTEMQVEHAKHLICIKVGDIPASTPFNPMNSLRNLQEQAALQLGVPMGNQSYQQGYQQPIYPTPSPTPSPGPSGPAEPECSNEWLQYYITSSQNGYHDSSPAPSYEG